MKIVVAKLKLPESKEVEYSTYVQRILNNLHIVISSTPIGDALRTECRMFPSLLNFTSIVYIDKWPEMALLSVAKKNLEEMKLVDKKTELKLAEMLVKCHLSIEEACITLYQEQKRKVYVTPKNYLDTIAFYSSSLQKIQKDNQERIQRLSQGIINLESTGKTVEKLKLLTKSLQPELDEKQKKAHEARDKNESEARKRAIEEKSLENETLAVSLQKSKLEALKSEAQKELDEVTPALEEAKSGLNNVSRDDISKMKVINNPTESIAILMQGVLLIMREDDNTDWGTAKIMISDMKFLDKLRTKVIEEIPENKMIKLRGLLKNPKFDIEAVSQSFSSAKNLAIWCNAVSSYYDAFKKVKQKRDKLKEIQAKYLESKKSLETKAKQLQDLIAEMKIGEEERKQIIDQVNMLNEKKEKAMRQISNAEKLVYLLKDEAIHWEKNIKELKDIEFEIIGNVFLSAISISYLGPFTGPLRSKLQNFWKDECTNIRLKCSKDYSLIETIGDKIEIEQWVMKGLPKDNSSIENAIIAIKSSSLPLMVDPQGQANLWIRSIEAKEKNFKTIKMNNEEFVKVLENGLQIGAHILIEDATEEIDFSLESILGKKIYENNKALQIRKIGRAHV